MLHIDICMIIHILIRIEMYLLMHNMVPYMMHIIYALYDAHNIHCDSLSDAQIYITVIYAH